MPTPAPAVQRLLSVTGGRALKLARGILTLHANKGIIPGHVHPWSRAIWWPAEISPGRRLLGWLLQHTFVPCEPHTASVRQPERGLGAGLECPPEKLTSSTGAASCWHQHPVPLPQHPHPPALSPQVRSDHDHYRHRHHKHHRHHYPRPHPRPHHFVRFIVSFGGTC